MVWTHFAVDLVVAMHSVGVVDVFHQEVRDWRVMTRVLAVKLSPIWELPLQGFTKNRVKRFVLVGANVDTANREGYH